MNMLKDKFNKNQLKTLDDAGNIPTDITMPLSKFQYRNQKQSITSLLDKYYPVPMKLEESKANQLIQGGDKDLTN